MQMILSYLLNTATTVPPNWSKGFEENQATGEE